MTPDTSPRSCLKCGQSFSSTGPANRICHACGRNNQDVKTPPRCIAQGATLSSEVVVRLQRRIDQEALV